MVIVKNSKNKHKNKRNTNYVSLVCFFIFGNKNVAR